MVRWKGPFAGEVAFERIPMASGVGFPDVASFQVEPRRRDEDGQRPGQDKVETPVLRVPQPRGPKGEEGHARRQKERRVKGEYQPFSEGSLQML